MCYMCSEWGFQIHDQLLSTRVMDLFYRHSLINCRQVMIRQVCLPKTKCVQLYFNTRKCLCLIQPVVASVDCCAILWHSVKFLLHNSVDVTLVTGLYASQLTEIVFLHCIELIKVMVGKWSKKEFCGTPYKHSIVMSFQNL